MRRTQLTAWRRSNLLACSVALVIAKVSPAAESGKPPTATSQKSLRKTRLVALASSMAIGKSVSVSAGLSRPWTIESHGGRRLLPRTTVRTLPAAKSEPVCRSELIKVA